MTKKTIYKWKFTVVRQREEEVGELVAVEERARVYVWVCVWGGERNNRETSYLYPKYSERNRVLFAHLWGTLSQLGYKQNHLQGDLEWGLFLCMSVCEHESRTGRKFRWNGEQLQPRESPRRAAKACCTRFKLQGRSRALLPASDRQQKSPLRTRSNLAASWPHKWTFPSFVAEDAARSWLALFVCFIA